ncbi:hypothetical protein [Streptomyces sp. NPDC090994]|uniref:hypothetical protein n=1 Tax=Streptomyces sp. NPDC090994 TaxID=3365969 RepID=UPI00380C53B6
MILASWDAYSDEHTDLDGWPHDADAYGLRQSKRDADTAAAFDTIHDSARHLLTTAETQLPQLPATSVQSRWVYQLGVLRDALDHLDALRQDWLSTRDSFPVGTGPGTPSYDDALADYHAESWSYLRDWADQGHTLTEIHRAARHTSPPAPRPTAAPLPAPASKVRR